MNDGIPDERFAEVMKRASSDRPALDNLKSIEWPTVEFYDYVHHRDTAWLAAHIAETMEPALSKEDIDSVYLAGLLHDIARTAKFGDKDPSHHQRGAEMADKILRASQYWSQERIISTTCRLIALHGHIQLGTQEPKLTALQEAERLESCRYKIGAPEGIMQIKKSCHISEMKTDFGRNPETVRKWMNFKGW